MLLVYSILDGNVLLRIAHKYKILSHIKMFSHAEPSHAMRREKKTERVPKGEMEQNKYSARK